MSSRALAQRRHLRSERRSAGNRDRRRNEPSDDGLSRSRFVAAMTRTSAGIGLLPPTRSKVRSCRTRSSATWVSGGSSPTSSRKMVPPSRELEAAEVALHGAGEGAFFVAEQLRGDQRRGNGAAVDRDEGPRGARRAPVNRARDKLLSGAGLAGDQHRRIGARDLLHEREEPAERAEEPTISSNIEVWLISSRRAMFSFWS